MLPDGAFLVLFNWLISGDSLYDYTPGRSCLFRAMVQVIYPYVVHPTHCHTRLGVQYYCDSIQVTINGAISRCQRACHQCLPNTLASYMFWSPPIVVHHWSSRLASRHRGSCNPWCPPTFSSESLFRRSKPPELHNVRSALCPAVCGRPCETARSMRVFWLARDSRLQMHRWKFTTITDSITACKPWSSIVKSTPSLWETWSLRVCFLCQQTRRLCIEQ